MKQDEHKKAYKAVEVLDVDYSISDLNIISLAKYHLDDTQKHRLGKSLTAYEEILESRPGR